MKQQKGDLMEANFFYLKLNVKKIQVKDAMYFLITEEKNCRYLAGINNRFLRYKETVKLETISLEDCDAVASVFAMTRTKKIPLHFYYSKRGKWIDIHMDNSFFDIENDLPEHIIIKYWSLKQYRKNKIKQILN